VAAATPVVAGVEGEIQVGIMVEGKLPAVLVVLMGHAFQLNVGGLIESYAMPVTSVPSEKWWTSTRDERCAYGVTAGALVAGAVATTGAGNGVPE
jgi:hypothetical protein